MTNSQKATREIENILLLPRLRKNWHLVPKSFGREVIKSEERKRDKILAIIDQVFQKGYDEGKRSYQKKYLEAIKQGVEKSRKLLKGLGKEKI